MTGNLPKPEDLRTLLDYDPETGVFVWRARTEDMFTDGTYSATRRCASWNSRCAGREALAYVGSHGYRCGAIGNVPVLAHRAAWAYVYGGWPSQNLDHINGNPLDNRICNLRIAPQSINIKNCHLSSSNTSGHAGVSWRSDRNKWKARIMVDYREIALGHFEAFDDAVAARKQAEKQYGFSVRHGEARP